jgi:catechol 2,3-dioxygenase-like lactoylglutathione lyase family enzyme
MITGSHAIIYTEDAEAARTFFRDVLELPSVDVGGGWLIFQLPPAELGVHPAGDPEPANGRHELFLLCDDIGATMGKLAAKGVEFTSAVSEQAWGLLTTLRVPGGGEIGLYQPLHPTAFDRPTADGGTAPAEATAD